MQTPYCLESRQGWGLGNRGTDGQWLCLVKEELGRKDLNKTIASKKLMQAVVWRPGGDCIHASRSIKTGFGPGSNNEDLGEGKVWEGH